MNFRIEDVCEINSESIGKNDSYTFINYLDTGNLTEGVIEEVKRLEIGVDKIPSRAKRKVKKGDILISTVRPNQKHYGMVSGEIENLIVSTGFAVIRAGNKVDSTYLYKYLTLPNIVEHLQSIAETSTTAYPSIKPSVIGDIEIQLPTLPEQKAIANILSSLDEKIELNSQMNKTLEEMAQALFKRWFVDFEFPNEDGEPYKSSGGEMVDSELGMIPKGWEVKILDNLCEITSSKRIFRKEYVEDGIPFYRSKEVIEKSKGNAISTELFITVDRYNEIKKKSGVPIKNDILLTSVGTLGVALLVDEEGFYFKDGNLTWFRNFNNVYLNSYIYLFLLSITGKQAIDSITIGSTQKALTISALKQIKVVIPSDTYMKQFGKISSILIEKIRSNNKEKEYLVSLRDILLPKLMSGEIRVTDLQN